MLPEVLLEQLDALNPMHFAPIRAVALGRMAVGQRHRPRLAALGAAQHRGIHLAVQLHEPARRGAHALVLGAAVRHEILEQVLLHAPRLPAAHLADRIDASGHDLGADAGVHERIGNLPERRRKHVRRRLVVHRLRERHEDQRDVHLVGNEVLGQVAVKAQHREAVRAHDAAQQLQQAHLHLERVPLVVARQVLKHALRERLRVVQQVDRSHVAAVLVRALERLLVLLLAAPLRVRLGKLELALTRLGLFADLALVLEAPELRARIRLVVALVGPCLRRVQVAEEEAHRRRLHLRMGVRARHGQERHRAVVRPDAPPPHLRSDTHGPERLCAALELGVCTAQHGGAGAIRREAPLDHTKEQALHHAVQAGVLRLVVRLLEIVHNGIQNRRAHLRRRRAAQQGEQRPEQRLAGDDLPVAQHHEAPEACAPQIRAQARVVLEQELTEVRRQLFGHRRVARRQLRDKRHELLQLRLLVLAHAHALHTRHISAFHRLPETRRIDPAQTLIVVPLRQELFRVRRRLALEQVLQRRQIRRVLQSPRLGAVH